MSLTRCIHHISFHWSASLPLLIDCPAIPVGHVVLLAASHSRPVLIPGSPYPCSFVMARRRKSSQWFGLTRAHAEVVVRDTQLLDVFRKDCRPHYVRRCASHGTRVTRVR